MAHQRNWGDTGQPLDKLEYVPRDNSWVKLLPEGHYILSATGYGASYWSQSGKIDVRLANGGEQSYFIKLSRTHVGKIMVEGEFESMKMLYTISPEMVPQPIGYGTYESDDDIHFFLCEFIDLYDELPDIDKFCQGVAELHRKSMDHSPNNQFGFQVTTCNGTVQQYTAWNPSWEAFFIETLKDAFRLEEQVHGPSTEIANMLPALYEKVCPRLLRPLETEGRTLRPCLIHGDLWDGNTAVNAKNGQPYIFDASAIWGHNEYEHHIWRPARYRIGKAFIREYFKHFPVSPPKDDWDDRNLLYSLVADLHSSILFKQTEKFRNMLIQSMRLLKDKFPHGYEGLAQRRDSETVVQDGGGRIQEQSEGSKEGAVPQMTVQESAQGHQEGQVRQDVQENASEHKEGDEGNRPETVE